jgi:hypothetical protein
MMTRRARKSWCEAHYVRRHGPFYYALSSVASWWYRRIRGLVELRRPR